MPKKPRHVVWAPKSKKDLRDVWRYYERVASPEIADKLLREIDEAGRRLTDEALMWRARDEIVPGLRSVLVHPYTVFYRIDDGVVEIVRVLHERSDLARVFSKKDLRPPKFGPVRKRFQQLRTAATPPHPDLLPSPSKTGVNALMASGAKERACARGEAAIRVAVHESPPAHETAGRIC
jgi:toxin ParE1/3/4